MAEIVVDGVRRTFELHVPREHFGSLVLVLHGNGAGGGRAMREWTTFDRQDVAVAYPDGVGDCWGDGRGVTTADEAGVDDVAFLRALIDWAADRHGTAPDRSVVAGISNGAFMAHRLALEASDRIAVLAAVAGTLPAAHAAITPAHAVSALLIHGARDSLAPIDGGYSRRRGPNGELRGRTLSLAETADRWREIDRCPPDATTATTPHSRRLTWPPGTGGTRVAAWTLLDGGHTWPGMPGEGWHEPVSQEFDAAEEITRFAAPLLIPRDRRR